MQVSPMKNIQSICNQINQIQIFMYSEAIAKDISSPA